MRRTLEPSAAIAATTATPAPTRAGPARRVGRVMVTSVALLVVTACTPSKSVEGQRRMAADSDPRYTNKAMLLLFEALVLDTLGCLPADDRAAIEQMPLQRMFGTTASEWRTVVAETLHLSPTFEVAVLDLWYRNSDEAQQKGVSYEPRSFAREFVDHYLEPGSRVDVWTDDALASAQERIRRRRPTSGCR